MLEGGAPKVTGGECRRGVECKSLGFPLRQQIFTKYFLQFSNRRWELKVQMQSIARFPFP